jgi:biopolymer transport protein ExbD
VAGSADEDSGITDINVTPLVDISLVLVIIFMVTAPMVVQSGIIVTSSKVTESLGKSTKSEAVQLKITNKAILVDNVKVTEDQFYPLMQQKMAANKKKLAIVTCDADAIHGRLVWVLDQTKRAGAKSLSIMREDKGKKAATEDQE